MCACRPPSTSAAESRQGSGRLTPWRSSARQAGQTLLEPPPNAPLSGTAPPAPLPESEVPRSPAAGAGRRVFERPGHRRTERGRYPPGWCAVASSEHLLPLAGRGCRTTGALEGPKARTHGGTGTARPGPRLRRSHELRGRASGDPKQPLSGIRELVERRQGRLTSKPRPDLSSPPSQLARPAGPSVTDAGPRRVVTTARWSDTNTQRG